MLNVRLKELRKQYSYSQEELASMLHVTRQTISKWEQGRSVPDADLLIRISEVFHVSVQNLLEEQAMPQADEEESIAKQLERLNYELAEKNRRGKRLWRIVRNCLLVILVLFLLSIVVSIISFTLYGSSKTAIEQVEEQVVEHIEHDSSK